MLKSLFTALASNVPSATADILSYTMLVVVAVYLLSGPIIVYIYYRKNKKERAATTPLPA